MSRTRNRFSSDFAGDAIARQRRTTATATPSVLMRPVKGTAHCEGCKARKPIRGKCKKGWRCDGCKKPKNEANNS